MPALPAQPPRLFYGWTIAAVSGLGLALGIATMVAATFSIFLGPIRSELGFSAAQMFIAPLAVTLAAAFSAPLVGALIDRTGARTIIVVSFLFEAAILASFYFLTDWLPGLYLRYALLGILAVGTTHVAFARIIALWFDRRRGLALGMALAGVGVGGIVMPLLCQGLISAFGWRLAYVVLAMLVAVLGVSMVLLLLRDSPAAMGLQPDGDLPGSNPAGAVQDGAVVLTSGVTLQAARTTGFYWMMLLTFFVVGVALQAMMLHMVPLLRGRGISAEVAAAAQSTIFAGLLAGRLITGWLMDRFFAPRVALAFLLAPIVGVGALAMGADGGFAFVAAALIGLAAGAEVDVIAYLTSRYFGMLQFSRIYGTFYALYSLGGGVGPLLTAEGVERGGGYGPVLWVHVLLLLAAAVSLALFPRFPVHAPPAAQ